MSTRENTAGIFAFVEGGEYMVALCLPVLDEFGGELPGTFTVVRQSFIDELHHRVQRGSIPHGQSVVYGGFREIEKPRDIP